MSRTGDSTKDFEEFVHTTGTRMLRTALLLCGDHQQAEDLTQTTYAKVFSRWRLVSRADHPVAYTRSILTRTYLSERRLRRSGEIPVESVEDADVASQADAVGLRLALFDALAQLSAPDRTVLVLRYWEDQSVAETAAGLGISESACRTRTSRALARLRTVYPDLEA
ncbi:MAG: SigE family RNA polymerase sigma factor [Nocardioides sp.]